MNEFEKWWNAPGLLRTPSDKEVAEHSWYSALLTAMTIANKQENHAAYDFLLGLYSQNPEYRQRHGIK